MPAQTFTGASRLVLVAAASFLTATVASAQDWSGYPPPPPSGYASGPYGEPGYGPPPGAYPPGYGQDGGYAPYPQRPYAQNPYPQNPYPQNYGPGGYAQDPYAPNYNPYAAQRRAWRRRQAEAQYQQAYAAPPAPPSYAQPAPEAPPAVAPAPVMAPPPPVAAPVPAPTAAPEPAFAQIPANAPPPAPPVAPIANAAPPVPAAAPVASIAPPEPKLAAPQSVALSPRIVDSASAYLAYMRKASAISAAFTDGASVAKEVRAGAAYEPKQFEEGAIAYAAIVALQEQSFIDGVRQASGGDPDRAQQIAVGLMANPGSAITFTGADAAAARASAALRRQGDALLAAGTRVKQSAYDVQHSAWSKTDVLNPEVRLATAKTLSATRQEPKREETEKLLKLVLAEQGAPVNPGEGATSPVISRGLALAALAVLGQAGDGGAERLQPLMAEEKGGECLHMAKLNLFQCLAVAGPHYEDIFCLGQHAMMDTAQCVIKASGVSHPVMTASAVVAPLAAPEEPAAVTAAPQDYWVPTGGQAMGADAARR